MMPQWRRGPAPNPVLSPDLRRGVALAALGESRRSVLGLYPVMDTENSHPVTFS